MPRLARRSAGDRVAARAGRLADSLLVAEETTFAQVRAEFKRGFDRALEHVNAALKAARTVDRLPLQTRMVGLVAARHREAIARCAKHVEVLGRVSAAMSLDSIEDELLLCEKTLADRYIGLSGEAARATAEVLADTVGVALTQYESMVRYDLGPLVQQQVQYAVRYEDTEEQVRARLLSPEPVGRPGCSGRGVWWRHASTIDEQARAVSIWVMNTVRTGTMDAFNRIGDGRR